MILQLRIMSVLLVAPVCQPLNGPVKIHAQNCLQAPGSRQDSCAKLFAGSG